VTGDDTKSLPDQTTRLLAVLAVAAPVLVLIAGSIYMQFRWVERGYDDAYITFRYARNLVEGRGLVYNPGERVEGYTTPLFAMISAAGIAVLGPDAAYPFAVVVNTLAMIAALVLFARTLRLQLSTRYVFAASLLFAAFTPFWWAIWSGMETAVVLLFFVLAWSALTHFGRRPQRRYLVALAAACALLVLVRADGFVGVFFIVSWAALSGRRREFLWAGATGAAGLAAITLWRLIYYDLPLPNTFYVKVAGGLDQRLAYAFREFQYFRALIPYVLVAVVGLVPVAIRSLRARPLRLAVDFEPFFAAGWLAYWFYVGGDIFGMRFLLILVPLGLYRIFVYLARIPVGPLRTGATTALLPLLLLVGFHLDLPTQAVVVDRRTDPWIALGNALAGVPRDTVIAVDAAGKIAYYSGLYAIDMYGLNDRRVAESEAREFVPGHSKTNPEYVLSREPDLVLCNLDSELNAQIFLSRERYLEAGYELAYMLYMGKDRPENGSIVDVRNASTKMKERWCLKGYTYGILARRDIEIPAAKPI
jgi:hypothetical protein